VDSDGSQRKVRTPKMSTNACFGVGGTGAAANLAAFFVSGNMPTMFGTRGNTVRATAVGRGAERNAVLAGDLKGLVYYIMID